MESGNWDSWNEFINAQHQKYNKSVSSKVAAEQFSHNEGQSGAQNKAKYEEFVLNLYFHIYYYYLRLLF